MAGHPSSTRITKELAMKRPISSSGRPRRAGGSGANPGSGLSLLRLLALFLMAAAGLVWVLSGSVQGQQVHRNPFEGRSTAWVRGSADAGFRENVHETTSLMAHGGQRSEHLRITAEQGSFIYYQYATSRALVSEELNASIWVRATRPGVQILGRMVLPHEPNPNSLDEPMTTLLRG